ncbi:DUF4386 domain-containing protein [Demequina litorisediminis]|uniref:DUF4386 domain-containing protein n=1 Tax=Demequina litorisediminis TaxID=1849022 RepID=A0ABQ6IJ71_9MICO|nr:DUF4386 domain-containing protein [Demequina litorisediminis]GMA36768.1 hypothetical protein GCM10025876_29720 [Demequina litorisediminis]
MANDRTLGVLAGVSYLVTHVTSVGAVTLYGAMLTDDGWAGASDGDARYLAGAMLDVVLAVAVVATAAFLWPLLRRRSAVGPVAYLALRVTEAATILAGASAVVAGVALRGAGEAASAGAMVELYRAAFLVGPGLVVPFHTVVLAAVLWRHRLAPRWIPLLGFVGGPLVLVSNLTVLLGLQEQVSALVMAAAVPVFAWEISLAVWLITRGIGAGAATPRAAQATAYVSA